MKYLFNIYIQKILKKYNFFFKDKCLFYQKISCQHTKLGETFLPAVVTVQLTGVSSYYSYWIMTKSFWVIMPRNSAREIVPRCFESNKGNGSSVSIQLRAPNLYWTEFCNARKAKSNDLHNAKSKTGYIDDLAMLEAKSS